MLAVFEDATISPVHSLPNATSRLEKRIACICGSASGAAITGAGQSAGSRCATMTFCGTLGCADPQPLVAMHAMTSQENQFLCR